MLATATSRPQGHDSKTQDGGYDYSVGTSIPANMPHAVSVSLPRWQDNVDYEEGRLTQIMKIGYPRFFIHKSIVKLSSILLKKLGTPAHDGQEAEDCLLVPSSTAADQCRSYLKDQYAKAHPSSSPTASLPVRVVQFSLVSPSAGGGSSSSSLADSGELSLSSAPVHLYIVLFPASAFPLAKSFWQHTGGGICSRLAEHCLRILEETGRLGDEGQGQKMPTSVKPTTPTSMSRGVSDGLGGASPSNAEPVHRRYSKNRHYSRGGGPSASLSTSKVNGGGSGSSGGIGGSATPEDPMASSLSSLTSLDGGVSCGDQTSYVEERYGRNLPASSARMAKTALKRRIAGTLLSDRQDQLPDAPHVGETAREGTGLSEDDVYLYPCGMSAIFQAHQLAMAWRTKHGHPAQPSTAALGKSVCFGFPYTDTLKVLQKWGPGCHFFGKGTDADLDDLEALLAAREISQSEPPILSLFCEFPSDPLLQSPNLTRIRSLADKYHFLVICDETIGNFLNVEVLPLCDVVVSSLTKVFSGDANVMGGSMVLNPLGPHAKQIRAVQEERYEDTYWPMDALFMERNSRDFAARVARIDDNAEALADLLHLEMRREQSGEIEPPSRCVIQGVYYPKYIAREQYDACRRKRSLLGCARGGGGYGGLFSIIFHTRCQSSRFYDALSCAKGPSLGTNFTLASPYTILAHYTELEWASEFGVHASLVRVSTGLEETSELIRMFAGALDAARSE